jgi:hypothetical protein
MPDILRIHEYREASPAERLIQALGLGIRPTAKVQDMYSAPIERGSAAPPRDLAA